MTPHEPGATQRTRPQRLPYSPAGPPDPDAQIKQVEQRLVAREAWVRYTAESLVQRAQQAVTPKSWVLPVLGGAAVLWLGWRWWHRHTRAAPASAALPVDAPSHHPDALAVMPLAGLVALGWPLLPATWRARFTPAAAKAAVSYGLLILRRLVGRRDR